MKIKSVALCSTLLVAALPVCSFANDAFTGFQAGVALGYDDVDMDWETTALYAPQIPTAPFPIFSDPKESLSDSTFSYGVFGSYNWSVSSNWIVGAELAIQDAGASDTLDYIPGGPGATGTTTDVDVNMSYLLGVKGGYLLNESTMLYSTLSLTQTEVETSTTCPSDGFICNPGSPAQTFSDDDDISGYALALGVEKSLGSNLSVRAEYRYADLGTASLSPTQVRDDEAVGVDADIDVTSQSLQLGAAYKF
ncbi:porin family protein [Alcanivorax sp. S6407]|uniref:outer membrane protein n=1 Tax=Alcanivorax sp. S6407 TaxID=2926424 RepID=UPI001FF52721|nr:porin family protein [Alcanivorax sp. S6407]MCK0154344.1 porin family protein [Alcanivorax sp. S6407]